MHARMLGKIDFMRKVCGAEKIAMPGRHDHVAHGSRVKHKTTELNDSCQLRHHRMQHEHLRQTKGQRKRRECCVQDHYKTFRGYVILRGRNVESWWLCLPISVCETALYTCVCDWGQRRENNTLCQVVSPPAQGWRVECVCVQTEAHNVSMT